MLTFTIAMMKFSVAIKGSSLAICLPITCTQFSNMEFAVVCGIRYNFGRPDYGLNMMTPLKTLIISQF